MIKGIEEKDWMRTGWGGVRGKKGEKNWRDEAASLSIFLSPFETDCSFIFLLLQHCIINNSHTVSYRKKIQTRAVFQFSLAIALVPFIFSSSFTHFPCVMISSLSLSTLHRQSAPLKWSSFDDDTMKKKVHVLSSHPLFPSRCRRHSYRLHDAMNEEEGREKSPAT